MTLFVGGIADGKLLNVDSTKPVVVVPHPIPPIVSWTDVIPISTKMKTDRYQRRWRAEPDGSILVVYVYEGTDG